MIEQTMKTLEFNKILYMLSEHASSDTVKQKILDLKPYLSENEVIIRMKETSEAKNVLTSMGLPPMPTMKDINKYLELAHKGAMLLPEQLSSVATFASSCVRMKKYLTKAETLGVDIASYGHSIHDLTDLLDEINLAIRGNLVDDLASKELKDIRRQIEMKKTQVKTKLEGILRSKKEWFTDGYVSIRNGHYVLPVKKEYKHQVSGSVLGTSSTGSTYFIEPTSVMKLEEELSMLEITEDNEVRKILYTLTVLVDDSAFSIGLNMEALETLDFMFAKAKLSLDMKGVAATVNTSRKIVIKNGRHPLLKQSECIPLNFTIGDSVMGVVITGPNTGGKTVALKTIGLIEIMAQCGLHVPCEKADLCMNNSVLCDIGDGQSITENLSTFSSHISNIIAILSHSDKDSLILLDELGSGTDPAEGMGIAISILEELQNKECLFVATTHYPQVKEYANNTDRVINARMAFDRESLKPLYQLEIGEAGESCALYIAKRLGLPKHMLERAYKEAYINDNIPAPNSIDAAFLDSAKEDAIMVTANRIEKKQEVKAISSHSMRFQIGDSVIVYPQKKIGIVYKTANEKGEVGVQIQKNKQLINHKRLQLKAPASELYPKDYDFSIIFDTVENRKARHKMEKAHRPGLEISYEDDI